MAKVEIYTTTTCPYCVAAKALLRSKGIPFDEIQISLSNEEQRNRMRERAGGRRTVPQIFIDDVGIGGSDDLMALNRAGKLDSMLDIAAAK